MVYRMKLTIPQIKYISTATFFGWSGLGFYRGIKNYDKTLMEKHVEINRNVSPIYLHKFLSGLLGVFFYVNPFFLVYILPKEIYRLEVNLRNLEDEKKSEYYNEFP